MNWGKMTPFRNSCHRSAKISHACRHVERELAQATNRHRCRLAIRAPAAHRLPAGDQMRGRRLSARTFRGAGLQHSSPRSKSIQWRGHSIQASFRRGDTSVAGRRCGRPGPFSRSRCVDQNRRGAHRLPLPAQWKPPDYNVIPTPSDVYDPSAWAGDALFLPQTRARFRALINLGLIDAVRAASDDAGLYTFWDYQAGAWQKNNGIRIDHLLMSPHAADRLVATGIDRHVRAWEKPSDHVPVWADFAE